MARILRIRPSAFRAMSRIRRSDQDGASELAEALTRLSDADTLPLVGDIPAMMPPVLHCWASPAHVLGPWVLYAFDAAHVDILGVSSLNPERIRN